MNTGAQLRAGGRRRSSASGSTEWVTSQTTTTTRNNYSDYVGCYFTVGASDIIVTHLGRWVISGNTGTHTVVIRNTSHTVVASVSVDTSGAPAGAYKYVALGTPYTLLANTSYYLMSQEVSGGDLWYDIGAFTTTGVTSSKSAAYGTPGTVFTSNQAYVPVSFKY